MLDSISHKANMFSILSGTDFETLLYRLYVAMGYSVMKQEKQGIKDATWSSIWVIREQLCRQNAITVPLGMQQFSKRSGHSNYIIVRRR
jgi:hypothetical protein